MRLAPIPPKDLTPVQRELHEAIRAGVEAHLSGFVWERTDGALIGPFNPMLHFPQFGVAMFALFMALSDNSTLPKQAHEVAILVAGARFGSRYELYSHEFVAARAGLSPEKISTIVAGERPADLTRQEGIAYDVASVLSRGKLLPETTYQAALAAFGESATAELILLTGLYCMVSILLNGYEISVPGREEGLS